MIPEKLFEGSEKETLDDVDRIATAIAGQEGANWISFLNLYTQIKNAIIALFSNKAVLDDLGDTGGQLTYNGNVVANTLASGASTEVQFRNAIGGALDSDPLFTYDKATGVLLCGKSFRDIPVLYSIYSGRQSTTDPTGSYNTSHGWTALAALTTGSNNTAIGSGALRVATTPNGNTAIGASSLLDNITGNNCTAIGDNSAGGYVDKNSIIAIGRGITKAVKTSFDFICGIGSYLYLEGNMDTGTRWFRVNAATLIRSVEVTAIAPLVTGTVTAGTANTLTDTTKTFILNQYANFVVKKTSIGGEQEQRVILSNTTSGQVTVDRNWLATPVVTDTYKIISATVITSDNLSSIYRFDLSSGFDHAVIFPLLSATFNRANIITYIEGYSGTARLHGFPSAGSGSLISGASEFELVANNEFVEHLIHYTAAPHWDLKTSTGIHAFGSSTWTAQVVTANANVFKPLNANITIKFIRRFSQVLIGGELWARYTSLTKRFLRFTVVCDVTLNGTPASVITIGIRQYKASTGLTTDVTFVGSNITIAGNGTKNTFVVTDLFEFDKEDRFQVIHKNDNNTNYTIIPQLVVN